MRRIDWNNTVQIDPEFRQEYGVVFACPFKERGGVTVRDYSGNRYDGTLNNGPTRAVDKWGGPALNLSQASAQYVTATAAVSDNTITLLAWAKPASFQANGSDPDYTVNSLITAAGEKNRLYFQRQGVSPAGDAQVRGYVLSSGGAIAIAVGATALSVDTWVQVAYTYDGTTGRVYLNGVLDGATAGSGAIDDASSYLIGATDYSGTSQEFDGSIAHPLICNRALTAEQIARLYLDPYAMYWQPSRHSFFVPGSSPPTSYATYLTLLGVG